MGSCLEQDVWERKYHLALERMERDEREFHALGEGLRRLALRLAGLARGRDAELDRLLDRLAAELRHVPSLGALEPLLEALAKAITTSDDHSPAGGDPDAASIDGLRADIARLQELLAAVSLRLGDMTRYLAVELERTGVGDREGRALDASVREEMRALGETTLAAADLGSLQAEVAARLSLIDRHFREYREREDARLAAYRDRAERMRDRVEELENQATSLQDSLRREHELALTDGLTSLPNRLAYERRMAEVEREVRERGAAACLGAFDIDHFKGINDTYGHGAGDAVLRIVGQTLARELEGRAFVARYGGEEFVVVFAGMGTDEAWELSLALCATVEKLAFHASSKPVTVTMSGGITRFGIDDTSAVAFDRADRALYAAKRAGRNRCVLL
ncbi:diguanylate cyclase [Luteibacter jiangsuensis]|uniref:diguanylate cyclase n=1 Tax=Luteibacter jiangsuensis TaxID=637577 RepID=A0ABT9T0K2_9GAMM|nr:GGDEF domain-containing protein [Luteibacter jiangsuensis]MDQ0010786.1 diguanylate cyclase [Luteibacter jiangsuensis]